MHISVEQLREIAGKLFDYLESTGQQQFEIDNDFYWSVPAEKRYDNYDQPIDLTMGQLSDDWAELEAIIQRGREPVGYGLVWLASILCRVGEKAR